jgi:hypothetical protein
MPAEGGGAVPESRVCALPGELYRIGTNGVLDRRSFDGTSFGAPAPVGSVDWSHSRGAFMVSGRLYTGSSDNNLYVRGFDGTASTTPTPLDLSGLNPASGAVFPVKNVTGMFFVPPAAGSTTS